MRRELGWEFLGSMNVTLKKKKKKKERRKKQIRLRILFLCPNSKVAVLKAGPSDSLEGDPQHWNPVVKLPHFRSLPLSLTYVMVLGSVCRQGDSVGLIQGAKGMIWAFSEYYWGAGVFQGKKKTREKGEAMERKKPTFVKSDWLKGISYF